MGPSPPSALLDEVAVELGVTVVRTFDLGLFGASLVERADGQHLVLKVAPDLDLETVWAAGAATAELLRSDGYPAAHYVGTGHVDAGVWSLQEVLPGVVPDRLDGALASQLVDLAMLHDRDAGGRRAWKLEARVAAERWLAALPESAAGPGFSEVMTATLEGAADAELLEATVVHGDFHHGNCLTERGEVVGVIDWEIGGPGDWRFDLVHLHFWTRVLPAIAEPEAAEVIAGTVDAIVPDDVAAFMLACQSLRCVFLESARRPDRVERLSTRILRSFDW